MKIVTILLSVLLHFSQASQLLHNEFLASVKASELSASPLPPNPVVCNSNTHLIHDQSDIDLLIKVCRENIKGDIVVAKTYPNESLDLGSISSISGNILIADCVGLSVVHFPELKRIDGTITVTNLAQLNAIIMPMLKSIKSLIWTKLPTLRDALIGRRLGKLEDLIIDGTALLDLDFLNGLEEVESMDINNNPYLQRIELEIRKVNKRLNIYSNYDGTDVRLNLLKSCGELLIKSVDSLHLDNLLSVDRSVTFVDNSLSHLNMKRLKRVNGTVSLISNPNLESVDIPVLSEVKGGIFVANNTKMRKLNRFSSLDKKSAMFSYEGPMHNWEIPYLRLIGGNNSVLEDVTHRNWTSLTTSSTTNANGETYFTLTYMETTASTATATIFSGVPLEDGPELMLNTVDKQNSALRLGQSTMRMTVLWFATVAFGIFFI